MVGQIFYYSQGLDRTSINYPPIFCGIGTGMHMYLQAHPAENVDASIEIRLGASTEARKWSIRVTQVRKDVKQDLLDKDTENDTQIV